MMKDNLEAAIFDLDGVLTDTARFHFMAWKQTLATYHIEVDDEVCELVKGISRTESLQLILHRANHSVTAKDFETILSEKNETYITMISTLTKEDVMPGIEALLMVLNEKHIPCVVASASRSATLILTQLGIAHYFHGVVDVTTIQHGKPAPDIFISACSLANTTAAHAIGFEDARAGIQAMKKCGMFAIAIGHTSLRLDAPDMYYATSATIRYEDIRACFEEVRQC